MSLWRSRSVAMGVVSVLVWSAPLLAQDALVKRGEEIFKTSPNKCPVCHKVGPKSTGGKMGPDLDGVANRHPEAWFAPYLINPKSVSQKNVMPVVKVPDADMKALVAWLMTLKGGK